MLFRRSGREYQGLTWVNYNPYFRETDLFVMPAKAGILVIENPGSRHAPG